jgi:CDP-diacylglycerol--serine O-phosphatidyltransferase
MRSWIPNSLTLGNLLCGILAILALFVEGAPEKATYLIGIALVLDVFDGAVARMLKVSGELGKQLDSLADMVSFGVVPGLTAYWLVHFWWQQHEVDMHWSMFVPLIIPLAAALRLAKFNIDTKQTYFFLGLPTPSATAVIMSLPLIMEFQSADFLSWWVGHPAFLGGISVFLSICMLVPIPLVSFKSPKGQGLHWIVYFLLICALPAAYFLKAMAVPLIVCLYLLMSMLFYRPHEVPSRD